jgi:hypothetical protein
MILPHGVFGALANLVTGAHVSEELHHQQPPNWTRSSARPIDPASPDATAWR